VRSKSLGLIKSSRVAFPEVQHIMPSNTQAFQCASAKVFWTLHWWTKESLIPVAGWSLVTFPFDQVPVDFLSREDAVRSLFEIIHNVCHLPPDSQIFMVPDGGRGLVSEHASLLDLVSGRYGVVSQERPLHIYIAGQWTMNNPNNNPTFSEWRYQISVLSVLPFLPPVDRNAQVDKAYSALFASVPEDWTASLDQLRQQYNDSQVPHAEKAPKSSSHKSSRELSSDDSDPPPAYQPFEISPLLNSESHRPRGWFWRFRAFVGFWSK